MFGGGAEKSARRWKLFFNQNVLLTLGLKIIISMAFDFSNLKRTRKMVKGKERYEAMIGSHGT